MALFGRKGKPDAQGETDNSASVEGGTVTLEPGTDYEGGNGAFEAQPVAVKTRRGRGPKQSGVKSGVVVGLNIGSNFIKAVEVTSKGGTLSVTAMGAVPTPPDSISNGVVMSVGALAEAIKELWRAAGIKSKTVVTSVSGTGSLVVRVIEVPKMTDRELGDNMKVDADRYIPFPPSEVVMDYKALRDLPSDPDSPNMEVLLAAAQQEIIDLHVRAIQSARLEFRAIDVEPLAAVRALQFAQARATGSDWVDYNDVSAVVNIGATATEISVLRGDIVVFTRIVPGGGNALTQAIADTLGVPFPEAEHIKVEAADALPPHGMETAQPAAQELDDFAAFGLDDDTAPISFDDFDTTPMGGGGGQASADPFDLDFFNQGPKQDEPGTGHGQAEGDDKPADPFSFNFSFADETPKAAEPAPAPAPAPGPVTPVTGFSFEGATPPQTAAPTPPQPEPSSEFVHAGPMEFSEDEFAIPARSTGEPAETTEPAASTSVPVSVAAETEGNLLPSRESAPDPDYTMSDPTGRGGISFNFDDDSLLPSVDTSPSLAPEDPAHEPATQGRPTPMPISGTPAGDAAAETILPSFGDPSAAFSPVPSAFDFGDLDLPTLSEDAPPTTEVSAGVAWTPGVATAVPPASSTPVPEVAAAPEPTFAAPVPAPAPEPAPEPVAAEPAPPPFSFAFGSEPPAPAAQAPEPATAPEPVSSPLDPVTTEFEAATQPFSFDTPADPFSGAAVSDDETFAISPGDTAPAAQGEVFEEPGAGDFDLDEIFGAGAFGAAAAPVAAAAPMSAPEPSMGDETFDLGSIGGELGDFGGGLTGDFGAEPDLSSFGAGLTGEQGYGGVDPLTLYAAVHPVVEDLANELRRSLEYHLSRFPDATISRVALVGGGAALLNLDYYMTQMLGIPTTVGNPFSQIEIAAPRLPPGYALDNGAICAVALGLALRDFVA